MIDTSHMRKLPLTIRIEENSIPVTECGCWIWLRKTSRFGYGVIDVGGKTMNAHRASWIAYRGPIPGGMLVCHQCDVAPCVNPDHLFLGTYLDNNRDRSRKGRSADWRGARNNNAKFSDNDIRYIRNSSNTRAELAAKFKTTQNVITDIRARRTWVHVQ